MLLFFDQQPRGPMAPARLRLRRKKRNSLRLLRRLTPQNRPLLSGIKGKEKYPIFIDMSRQQYRNERAKVLRKLIGKNSKTLRDYHGLTIEQVSEATNISISQLKKLEAGRLNVTPSMLLTICDHFHVLIDCMARQDLSLYQ